jgi:hypothetical protein
MQKEGAKVERTPAPNIQVGSQVWLATHNIETICPIWKMDWKCLGPFTVPQRIFLYASELELPVSIQIYRVQPILLLDLVNMDLWERQVVPPPPPVEVDEKHEYKLSWVDDIRIYCNQLQCLI